jgi:ribonuclease Z
MLKKGMSIQRNGQTINASELTTPAPLPRSFAFCSDTAFDENTAKKIKNIDMLYHEATFLEEDAENAKQYKHSTAKQAATIAKLANVRKLIIGHFSTRYYNAKPFLSQAKEIFPETILAYDGLTIEIDKIHNFLIKE